MRGKFWSVFLVWCAVLTITLITLFLTAQIVLLSIVGGVFVFSFILPLFYANRHIQTKYRLSENVRLTTRIVVMLTATLLAPFIVLFSLLYITLITEGHATTFYLGPAESNLIMNGIAPIVGACVGYFIVKKNTANTDPLMVQNFQ
ncbi:MAG: hypothetical protein CW716_07120 [Candidatus Bathyarchaeum sp.]|nr:MAG: hypothetical protein CW716_07120 [Candidatus Bathyarchaeum sp.]